MPWRGRQHPCSEYSLASLHGCFTCRGSRQVIFDYNPGSSRIGRVLTDVTDMSTGMLGFSTGRTCMASLCIDTGRDFNECYFCYVTLIMHVVAMVGHKIRMNGSMVFYELLKRL